MLPLHFPVRFLYNRPTEIFYFILSLLYPLKPLSPSCLSAYNFISYFPKNIDATVRVSTCPHVSYTLPPSSCCVTYVFLLLCKVHPMCEAHLMPSCFFKDIIPSALLSLLSFLFSTGSNPNANILWFFFFNLKNLSTTKLFTATVPFMAVFLENFSTINSIRMGICDVRFSAVLPVFRKTMPDQGRMQVFVEQILYLDFFFCSLWLNSYLKLYIFVKKLLSIWLQWVLVVACRFFSCSMQTLSWGMQGLVYWPGIESRSPALGVQSLSHWTTWEVPLFDSIRNPFFTCLNGSIWHYWSFSLSWSSFSWLSPENIALFWFLISLTGHTSLSWFFFIHSLKVRVC